MISVFHRMISVLQVFMGFPRIVCIGYVNIHSTILCAENEHTLSSGTLDKLNIERSSINSTVTIRLTNKISRWFLYNKMRIE